MKFNLKDELDLLLQLRSENFGQDLPESEPAGEAESRLLAQKAMEKLYAKKPPVIETPAEFLPGQIWQTRTIDQDFPAGPFGPRTFILTNIVKEGDVIDIMGVPISEDWRFAAPQDLVVGPGGGMPHIHADEWVMIELHLETNLPEKSLARFVGEVSDALFARIQSLLTWMDGDEVERAFMGVEYARAENNSVLGPPLEKWGIKDPVTGDIHTLLMGQQIVGKDDPRLEYKKLSVEDLDYLVQPMLDAEPQWVEEEETEKKRLDIQALISQLSKLEEAVGSMNRKLDDLAVQIKDIRSSNDNPDQSLTKREQSAWDALSEVPSKTTKSALMH